MFHLEDRDGIRLLRMQHGKANAFDLEFALALTDAMEGAERDPVDAVVLTGTGNIFSAGVDLHRVVEEGAPYLETFLPPLDRSFESCLRLTKPLVAAINGHAIAGGGVLACLCDYRVLGAGSAKIGVPELLVGVPFPPVALEVIRAAVPLDHFRRIVLGGQLVSGEAAVASGFADEIVEGDRLEESAAEWARRLASIPTATFAQHKRDWRAPLFAGVTDGAFAEVQRVWKSPETLQAIANYVEKTFK